MRLTCGRARGASSRCACECGLGGRLRHGDADAARGAGRQLLPAAVHASHGFRRLDSAPLCCRHACMPEWRLPYRVCRPAGRRGRTTLSCAAPWPILATCSLRTPILSPPFSSCPLPPPPPPPGLWQEAAWRFVVEMFAAAAVDWKQQGGAGSDVSSCADSDVSCLCQTPAGINQQVYA